MSSASFYKWRSKYGGMDASLMARMKELDEENKRLKKVYAEKSMQNDLLQEALGKSGEAVSTQRDGRMGGTASIRKHRDGLPGVPHQRDLLSVSTEAQRRE